MMDKDQRSQHMVSECANPNCRKPFIYFRHGKLFSVPRAIASATRATIEHFWLCQSCAESMDIEVHHGSNPSLVSRRPSGKILQLEYQL
jgi:hypothetical protein